MRARLSILRTQSDERLLELARSGSDAAFEAIVQRYRRQLVRYCARVLGDADAEEAVQEALIRAHGALTRGASVRKLGPWLHAVAHNAALGVLRRRLAGPQPLDLVGEDAGSRLGHVVLERHHAALLVGHEWLSALHFLVQGIQRPDNFWRKTGQQVLTSGDDGSTFSRCASLSTSQS